MPTTYTPDPTATQAPAAQPDPDDFPLESLPNSGEGCTAASIAQAFKVVGDFVAWLKKPRAAASAWGQAVRRYKDARLNDRFIIDHFGLPRGNWFARRETFGRRTDWGITGAGTGSVREWDLAVTGAASRISANNAFGNFLTSYLEIEIDNAAVNTGQMKLADDANTTVWSTGMLAMVDYILEATDSGAATTWVHGVGGQTEQINTINNGAFFISAAGGNWHARTISGGVNTDTDTGIAATAGVAHHFLIAMVGSGVSDDSTTRCLFFIDGVLKANHTAHIPIGAQVHPLRGGFTSGAGGGTRKIRFDGPNWTQITAAATP